MKIYDCDRGLPRCPHCVGKSQCPHFITDVAAQPTPSTPFAPLTKGSQALYGTDSLKK